MNAAVDVPVPPVEMPRAAVFLTPQTRAVLGRRWDRIARDLDDTFSDSPRFEVTDGATTARHVCDVDPQVVVAAGGDGTVNLALQGIRPHDQLALLPLGTANDLARSLNLPLKSPRVQLGRRRRIDVLQVNGRRFCTTGGLGLPADIAHRVNEIRTGSAWVNRMYGVLGSTIYAVVSAFVVVAGPRRHRLRLRWTDADAPARSDLVIYRATRASIASDTETRFFGDGEVLNEGASFELDVEPGALRLLC